MTQKAFAIALAMLLAVAGAAAVSAATQTDAQTTNLLAPDFDNVSEWTDGDTVDDFRANSSKGAYTNQTVSTENPEVRLADNETGEVFKTWSTDDLLQTHSDDVNNDYSYRANISHGDLDELDIRANETKDIQVRYKSNASVSDENATWTNVTVEITAADDYNNFRVADHLISTTDIMDFETDGFDVLGMSLFQDSMAHFQADDVDVNGSGSTVEIHMVNDTADSRLSSSLESVTGSNWDKSTLVTLTNDDGEKTYVKPYTELPDSVDEESDTYALVDDSTGTTTIHLGDDFEDADSVDVNVKTNVGAYPAFARGLDLWMQNFEWSVDHFNPLAISGEIGLAAIA
jgi:hypothetical protein